MVVDKFNHDSSWETRARFRYQSHSEALPVANLNLPVPDQRKKGSEARPRYWQELGLGEVAIDLILAVCR
jgi:hypothetical protein